MPNYQQSPNGRLIDSDSTPDERTYATFMHLSVFAVNFTGIIILVALVMWLIKRKQSRFLDDHGKEAVNFQISLLIYSLISGLLVFVLVGIPMLVAVYLLGMVGSVLAAIAANRGEFYRYPMTIRLVA